VQTTVKKFPVTTAARKNLKYPREFFSIGGLSIRASLSDQFSEGTGGAPLRKSFAFPLRTVYGLSVIFSLGGFIPKEFFYGLGRIEPGYRLYISFL
jgi:hypothetical protein